VLLAGGAGCRSQGARSVTLVESRVPGPRSQLPSPKSQVSDPRSQVWDLVLSEFRERSGVVLVGTLLEGLLVERAVALDDGVAREVAPAALPAGLRDPPPQRRLLEDRDRRLRHALDVADGLE